MALALNTTEAIWFESLWLKWHRIEEEKIVRELNPLHTITSAIHIHRRCKIWVENIWNSNLEIFAFKCNWCILDLLMFFFFLSNYLFNQKTKHVLDSIIYFSLFNGDWISVICMRFFEEIIKCIMVNCF